MPPTREESENSSKNCASSTFSLHTLDPATLLPPICPLCGAPGLHPLPIRKTDEKNPLPFLEAHYCDLCAESIEDNTTRRLASTLAAGIAAVAFATALTFYFGLRYPLIQWFLVALVAGALPLLSEKWGIWRPAPQAVEELGDGKHPRGERTLRVQHEAFACALSEAGMPGRHAELPERDTLSRKFQQKWPIGLVLTLGLLWWGLLHFFGVAQVRVIYGGERSATLLIDDRHSGELRATYSEDPEAGRILQVLGGRRKFALISSQGALLAEEMRILWPGGAYIVAVLPTGMCLFSETMSYGQAGAENLFVPLPGPGPIWEVEGRVDSWFEPLAPAKSEVGSSIGSEADSMHQAAAAPRAAAVPAAEEVEHSLSGGSRRAIRLLPCRPILGN